MSEVESSPAGERASGASWRNLVGVLSAPEDGFGALARRPTWAIALLLLAVVGAVAVMVSFDKVDPADITRMMEEQGRELPPDTDPERAMGFFKWSSVAGAALFSPLFYALMALAFWATLRLLGSDLDYRRSLAVSVHGMLPFGVAGIVGIVVASVRDRISMVELQAGDLVMSHLGFLAGEDTSPIVRALLTSVDLFSIWCLVLLAIGFRTVGRVAKGAAWGVVGSIWGVGVVLKLVLASFQR